MLNSNLYKYIITLLSLLLIFNSSSQAQEQQSDQKTVVYYFELDMDIMPAALRTVNRAFAGADTVGADLLFMRLNTYGGMVNIADSIRTSLLNSPIPTVVWIDKNAASAGALISIACDSIYMARGANIGAATVVDQAGAQMPDKYQSYMRSTMRSTAEAKGRDPKIAEAMVDDRVHIPGIIDSGYTLTFTTTEAIAHGYCQGAAESMEDVLTQMGIENYDVVRHQVSIMDKIISFLLNPVVSSLLLLLIMGGLWFELQTPGVGFPLVAAITAAVLYFAPLYIEGIAQHWEILLFVLGLILIAIEVFVLPGFGVAGVSGIILMIAGLTLALVPGFSYDFSFPYAFTNDLLMAFIRVTGTLTAALIIALFLGPRMFKLGAFNKLVLMESQTNAEGYHLHTDEYESLVGLTGIAVTSLRPSGKVEIADQRYEATTDGEYITKGEAVKVIKHLRSYIVVTKAPQA